MNESVFKDKVVIITGASSGIGLASAKLFASRGSHVVLAARSIEKFLSTNEKQESNPDLDWLLDDLDRHLLIKTDVSKEEDCKKLIEKTIEKFARIDILLNNAGISMRAMFKDLDLSVIKSLMDVNFWGTVYCTKYALPYLLKSKGSLVGVVSIAAYSALPARSGYSSSKYAIRGFLDTIRIEHLKDGLNVLVFAPGYTSSNIRKTALTKDGNPQGETPLNESKIMSAEDCAKHLLSAISKRKNTSILTLLGKIAVLLHNLFPSLMDRLSYWYISREKDSPFK